MALSRSARIIFLLAIDTVFLLIELIVGYAMGSLALVADSFHMLNDVMSLVVALYAIKLTANSSANSRYTYGWHRAETIAALINGVFLLALCFSIFLDAIERFFSNPEISSPRHVVALGSLGLASKAIGLYLFHEHGHSHTHTPSETQPSRPESIVGSSVESTPQDSGSQTPTELEFSSLYGHPIATRASLVQQAQEIALSRSLTRRLSTSLPRTPIDSEISPHAGSSDEGLLSGTVSTERTPLLRTKHGHDHSHSHGSIMRGLVLQVLGDALGNVGVILSGLVIWHTRWSFKHYFDPISSLVTTVIIFSNALSLVRSASYILLQGVPPAISLDVVRDSIMKVDGVLSVHELHVWQLSEPKVIASAHVLISQNRDFMPIAVKIREALHDHGIHSSTIQPESRGLGTDDLQEQGQGEISCLVLCPPDQASTGLVLTQGKEPDFCSLDKLSSVVALEDDAVDAVLDGTSDEGYASRIPGPIDRVLGKALITSGPGLCRS